MSIATLSELFLVTAQHDKPDCLLHKVGDRFVPVPTRELVRRVRQLASTLQTLGVAPGDRVALMAESGPHWPTIDFATLAIGGVLVPIYPTLLPEAAAYIARDSGANILFVEGRERLEGLLAVRDEMPGIERFVLIDPEAAPEGDVTTLEALVGQGEGADPAAFEATARRCKPDDLATFIYTSGTTGNPKGVMLTHGNIASNVVACLDVLDVQPGWVALSFLPLSHSFERTVDYIYFYRGVSIAYAESVQAVAQNLQEARPHIFVSVPRVYEKVLSRIHENVAKSPPLRQKIFHWATGVGRQALPYRLADRQPPGLLGVKLRVADKLVFAKIRERLGGRFVFAFSGGAPLAPEIAAFFWAAGIRIFEGYGLSETAPVLTGNCPNRVKLGTVGTAIPGVELHLAEDGEILAKGPNIMVGYFNNPSATAEAIDDEGWFHTGDIGTLDDEGFLTITDRKKELIVNAYGKNIAPAPIENALKASRFIGQAVVIGDRRKFLSALLVPDFEALTGWSRAKGIAATDGAALVAEEAVLELMAREVGTVNAKLARYEQIQAWRLLPQEFTLETGELTPTQKVKRRVITTKFKAVIDELYEKAEKKGAASVA